MRINEIRLLYSFNKASTTPVVRSYTENAPTEYLRLYCPAKLNRAEILASQR